MRMDDQPGEKSEKPPASNNPRKAASDKPRAQNQKDDARTGQQGAMGGALAQALASARKDGR